ncbi:MAG: hypothetical protein JW902_15500, partial [Syntrophaceae bacterium]|nr:hypothetical protein [Syntrophaceae bacterium]
MTILQEVKDEIMAFLGRDALEMTVERLVVGIFFTGVKLSTGTGGLCFTPVKDVPEAVCCPSSAGRIRDPRMIQGCNVAVILEDLKSREPLRKAAAIAVLNALSVACWDRGLAGDYAILSRTDAQDLIDLKGERKVTVIGALGPVLQKLKKRGGTWWVVEQDPRTLRSDETAHFFPADHAGEVIGRSDILVVTGVTLLNDTLEGILQQAKPGADICVMGPTAGMLPEPLFTRGVRVVGGVRIKAPDALLDVLA